jgi:phosphoenolpyruvate---glycerone phosphotransferase subunit DhaM
MVGVVVVSHSAKVAEGILDLAMQMVKPGQQVVAAGGMKDGSVGTDAATIRQAVMKAFSDEGVVVLVDLGSAVLCTEMVLESLDENIRPLIRIADAPILEGTIAAVVEASIESPLPKVLATAESAREIHKR